MSFSFLLDEEAVAIVLFIQVLICLRILDDFEYLAEQSKKNPDLFIGNPVNSFLLLKKLTKDFQMFVDSLNFSVYLTGLMY